MSCASNNIYVLKVFALYKNGVPISGTLSTNLLLRCKIYYQFKTFVLLDLFCEKYLKASA